MTNPILVTGATGNVGSQVVQQLTAIGAPIRVAVRSIGKAEDLKAANVELVEMDMNHPESVQAAFAGAEKVFLVSPFVPNMVELSAILVDAAKQAGVKHIVRLSALGANAESGTLLSSWHGQVEQMIKDSGIPFTLLRPNGFMQNYVNQSADTIKTQNAFYQNLGDAKVSYVDIRDIAAVATHILTQGGHEGQAYEITGSEALSNQQIAETLSQVLGRTIQYIDVPDDAILQGMQGVGMPEAIVQALLELYALYKTGFAAATSPTVEQVTGKKPISFEQFARDYAKAFA